MKFGNFFKSSKTKAHVVPDLIILPTPKSPPADDGYSTGSQNTPSLSSATLYSPHSFITSKQQQENSSKNKFFKSSKKFNLGSKKQSLSPSQVKKQINSTAPKSPPPQVEIKVDSPPPKTNEVTEEDNRKKMDTLTREEISDLNDLLSIFDGGEQTSSTKKEESPKLNYFQSRTLGRKPKLQEDKKQEEQTITKQELLERPTKGNIPRTQSQNYGRRSEGDDVTTTSEDRPRRPMGRSKTLTRPARNAYAKSLDRERAKKETKKADDLGFLQDVVSELLAVGKVEEPSVVLQQKPLRRPLSVESPREKERLPRSVGSIENFFDNLETQAEIYAKSLDNQDDEEEDDESTASEAENDVFSTEGNDSGIEDEAMPGVTKDTSHKRKSSSRNRKQHDDNGENRSSKKHDEKRREKDKVRRSESEPKKSKKHGKKSKSSGDVTVRIDGVDYNGETVARHGRSHERRSEPPLPTNKVDSKSKVKSLKSSSESSSHLTKSQTRNDLEGGQIENQQRSTSDSHVHKHHRREKERSKSPEKKEHKHRSKSPTKNGVGVSTTLRTGDYRRSTDEGVQVKRNNSIHNPSSTKSSEYAYDTTGGKHRVYVLPSKNEDPGPLPKKEQIRDFDDNIRTMMRGKKSDEDLVKTLGVSPDILKMLREEEKFWQRQQELKEWRQAKDSTYKHPPPPAASSHQYQPPQQDNHHNKPTPAYQATAIKDPSMDAEVLREAAENRLALQAEKLMKVRAEQQHILRTSRENLLDEPDRPPPPRNYKTSSRSSSSGHSHTTRSSFPTTPTSPLSSEHAYPPYPQYANLPHTQAPGDEPPPPVNRSNKSRTYEPKYTTGPTKVVPVMGVFSDDDDEIRSPTTSESRGYFSDEGFRDNTISKTHLARPMLRPVTEALKCTHCSNLIKDNRLIVVDKEGFHWHPACFRCVVCRALLSDSSAIRVRMVGVKLHCRFCTSARNGEQILSEV